MIDNKLDKTDQARNKTKTFVKKEQAYSVNKINQTDDQSKAMYLQAKHLSFAAILRLASLKTLSI